MYLEESSLKIKLPARIWTWICENATIPNFITIFGFYLTWKMAVLRWEGMADISTFLLLGCAALTDLLDGLLAKILDEGTPLGSALDKLRDKVLILSTGYFAYQSYKTICLISIPARTIAVIEIFLLLIGALVWLTGVKLRANEFGRWKMGFECATVICWAILNDLRPYGLSVNDDLPLQLIFILLSISLVLALASAYGQIKDNWALIKKLASVVRSYY